MKFKVHDQQSAPEASQPLLEQAKKGMGMVPNVLGVLAESPLALEAYMTLDGMRSKSAFSKEEQVFILLVVSAANTCGYCVAAHTMIARNGGVSEAVVNALRAGEPVPDKKLEALRKFVIQVQEQRGWVGDEALEAFAAAGYSERHVLDVLVMLAQKTISNFANHMAGTPVDEAFAKFKWQGGA